MNAPSFLLFFIIGGGGRLQLPLTICLAVKGDGRPQEPRFRVSEMGVLQTPKRFLPSKLHEVQLTRAHRDVATFLSRGLAILRALRLLVLLHFGRCQRETTSAKFPRFAKPGSLPRKSSLPTFFQESRRAWKRQAKKPLSRKAQGLFCVCPHSISMTCSSTR